MASIVEAFDSTMKEAFTGLKIFLWSIPVCIAFNSGNIFGVFFIPVLVVLMTGFCVLLAHNTIAKEPSIVPGCNFIKMAYAGIFSLLFMAPYALLGAAVYFGLTIVKIPSPVWNTTFQIVVLLFAAALPLTACAIYVRRLNIMEIFNFKKYSIGLWEVFISFSYLLVKLVLTSAVVVGFLYYLFSLFVGFDNWFWTYLLSSVTVFYLIISANYLAQISEEIYTFPEKKEKEEEERQRISRMVSR